MTARDRPAAQAIMRDELNVSRETIARLERYEALLRQWSPKINLIAPNSLDHIWSRHFLDSAQLLSLLPGHTQSWLDLGSGAGFPGLVIAACCPEIDMILIEADTRKCVFLRRAASAMGLSPGIVNARIESARIENEAARGQTPEPPAGRTEPPEPPRIISARALAPLPRLFELATPLAGPTTTMLFLKGRNWQAEVEEAHKRWTFSLDAHKSRTDPEAAILTITRLRRNSQN